MKRLVSSQIPTIVTTIVAIITLFRQAHAVFPHFDESKLITENASKCEADATGPDGNHIDQRASLHWALVDANTIAHAGIVAAAHPNDPPFDYFFDPTDNVTVARILQTVIDMTEDPGSFHSGTHISMGCNDPDQCRSQKQWGYAAQWSVTICQYGLNVLKRNPPACTKNPGLPSLGWVGLKYLLQMWDVRSTDRLVGNYAFGPMACHALVARGPGHATANAENYAYMASWAYDLGLKGDGPYYGAPCPEHWNTQILLPPWAADGTTDQHSGLD